MNRKVFLIIILSIGLFPYFLTGLGAEQPAEDLEIVVGFGGDTEEQENGGVVFFGPSSIYTFEENETLTSSTRAGYGKTPALTRENRQIYSNKQYILGLEKVYLLGESMAKYGLEVPIEIFFRNTNTNDNAFVAICGKKPNVIFDLKIKGYPSSADYIEGMLKNAQYYNFFSLPYKISDIYLNLDAEGRTLVLPYVDIIDKELVLSGVCLFKRDKMIGKLNMNDSKTLNMLSETKGKGIISLITDSHKHLDYYAKVKRTVKVYKSNDEFTYVIDLKFLGDLISDTMYIASENEVDTNNEIKAKLEQKIKQSCDDLINKLQNQYKVDALQLGQYAAAKYGRGSGADWDDIFTNADIEVNVKVQIDKTGRGNYFLEKQSDN